MVHQCSSYTYIYIYIYIYIKWVNHAPDPETWFSVWKTLSVHQDPSPARARPCVTSPRIGCCGWAKVFSGDLMSWTSPGDLTMRQRLIKVDQGWSRLMICKWCGRKTWFKQDHTGINLNLLKSVYLYVCFCVFIYLCIYIFISLYIYIYLYLSNYLSI